MDKFKNKTFCKSTKTGKLTKNKLYLGYPDKNMSLRAVKIKRKKNGFSYKTDDGIEGKIKMKKKNISLKKVFKNLRGSLKKYKVSSNAVNNLVNNLNLNSPDSLKYLSIGKLSKERKQKKNLGHFSI